MSAAVSRRHAIALAGATAAATVLGGCEVLPRRRAAVEPSSSEVSSAEARRRRPGATVRVVNLSAATGTLDLAGRAVTAWGYDGMVPGRLLRVRAGEVLRLRLANRLPEPTTIHWHGIALRNDMDGVPDMTQPPIRPGAAFTYEFAVPDPGTYFFHPHVGLQLDRGLYAPLIVDDPDEPGRYDREAVLVLDDWTLGVGPSPEEIQAQLRSRGGMGDMGGMMGGMMGGANASGPLGGSGGEVGYPLYLLNGRPPADPLTINGRPGERLRLRVINAGADTAFRLAVGGHRLTVTHTDGTPVTPVTVDAVVLGMGERYDALVTLGDGAFPVVALAEGKPGHAAALLRTGAAEAPAAEAQPAELDGRVLALSELRADPRVAMPRKRTDRTHRLVLSGGMMSSQWTINGKTFDDAEPLPLQHGERVRLDFVNRSMMFHPMHVHGHTFQVRQEGGTGPRKDTAIVRPMETVAVDLAADNPGQWMVHCHNLFHLEAGMMTTLSYVR